MKNWLFFCGTLPTFILSLSYLQTIDVFHSIHGRSKQSKGMEGAIPIIVRAQQGNFLPIDLECIPQNIDNARLFLAMLCSSYPSRTVSGVKTASDLF